MNDIKDEKLAARAKLILRELRFRRPTLLQEWMAQYVAECLEALEESPRDSVTKDRCAATIVRLWKMYIEHERQTLGRGVDEYRLRATLNEAALVALKAELNGTEHVNEKLSAASAVELRHLTALEEQVLEVWWASAAVSHATDGEPDSVAGNDEGSGVTAGEKAAARQLADARAELREATKTKAQRIVAAVFPEFAALSLTDADAVTGAVTAALRAIDRGRRRRLWHTEAQEASDSSTEQ